MVGNLPRTFFSRSTLKTRRPLRHGVALVLGLIVLLAGKLLSADNQGSGESTVPEPAQKKLSEIRRAAGCPVTPTVDVGQEYRIRGRQSLQITGRERAAEGDAPGPMRDLAVFDPAAGRIVSFVCFPNASDRKSGEAIFSLAEVSSRSDRVMRAILPGTKLELESTRRHRADGTESVYYEARYLTAAGEFPFLEPPVRLLINATTGSLFRLDIDPDWLDPPQPPRVRISRKAAERIATVVLRGRDLAPAFGSGAVLGSVAAAEMFTVRPNGWLDIFSDQEDARARVAWVVPFRVDGAPGLHSLFVDAATGQVVGGLPGESSAPPR